jgi:hypothetical protein
MRVLTYLASNSIRQQAMIGTSTHHQVDGSESGAVQARREADVEWIRELYPEMLAK